MIENYLADALCEFLTQALADSYAVLPPKLGKPPGMLNVQETEPPETQEDPEEKPKIHIFNGYVPSKEPDEKVFPYVSVILVSGVLDESSCTCKSVIDCGIYSKDDLGHKDLLNLMRRISQSLRTLKYGYLADKFVLNGQISWTASPENLNPYWHGSIVVEWRYYVPQPIDKDL